MHDLHPVSVGRVTGVAAANFAMKSEPLLNRACTSLRCTTELEFLNSLWGLETEEE